jgi:ribonuclease VapC
MTIDTSAVLAILQGEPERDRFLECIGAAERCQISAMSVLEASLILEQRRGVDACADLDQFLRAAAIAIAPFDEGQIEWARVAFRRYGKGRHPAGLNFGDCAAYALSRSSGEALLFKGTDFAKTDVTAAAEKAG